jgi:hypothetical protein
LEESIILNYSGIIQYETIGELIHTFKEKIHSKGVTVGTYKKILLVMIEVLENIMKHSIQIGECLQDLKGRNFVPEVSIHEIGRYYVIAATNLVRKANVAEFRSKLDYLNALDQQGLKDYYKDTITNGIFTKQGGASLGLIEIAKISSDGILYKFEEMGDQCSKFYMTIRIQ